MTEHSMFRKEVVQENGWAVCGDDYAVMTGELLASEEVHGGEEETWKEWREGKHPRRYETPELWMCSATHMKIHRQMKGHTVLRHLSPITVH